MKRVTNSGFQLLLLGLGFASVVAFAAEQPPTLRLPDTVAPTSYRVKLAIDPAKNTFDGDIAIKVKVKQPVDTIWLNGTNLNVHEAIFSINGNSLTPQIVPGGTDFLGLHFQHQVPAGEGEIRIRYTGRVRLRDSSGVFRMVEGGDNYIFTQFESTDARAAFPCFDEPSYKVPWQLSLTVPRGQKVDSNTPIEKQQQEGDQVTYIFRRTKPLPSYLIAFAVGPLEFVNAGTAGRNHVPVRIVTPRGHAADAKYAAAVTAKILTLEENYFGIPYPYAKLDNVAIPTTFGFGAMENAGMVTYAQTIILADPKRDTITRQREYASVAAHELAHQWTGDLVTTAWWNDIWLNEAFATWMEQKILAEWHPEWQTRVDDVNSKLEAEDADSLISAREIRQPIKSKNDISNAFDEITYQKGAAVIGMFERWIGAKEFQKGMHAYLEKYAFGNATAPEFLDTMSAVTGKEVTPAFSTFLNQAGVPVVSMALDCSRGAPELDLTQKRFLPLGTKGSASQLWDIPVCIRYGDGAKGASACKLMMQPAMRWKLKGACPAWVEGDDQAVGYYRVHYEHNLLEALSSGDVGQRMESAERVDFMGNAEALSNAGKLPAADALGLVEKFHADPQRYVVLSALQLAAQPVLHLVPETLMPNFQRFILKNFQARAEQLGWTPKQGESDNVTLLRPTLLRIVSTYGGDKRLASEAREQTDKWLQNHDAVHPELVTAVLGTSAYYGDQALFERYLSAFQHTQDRHQRERLITAMMRFRDPAAINAGMEAVLSGKIPFMEGFQLLFAGQRQASTRHMAFDFLKAHYREIIKNRPTGGGFDMGSYLPEVGELYCTESGKREIENFFKPRIGEFTGGPRMLSQVVEGIGVCIAEKKAQEPSVEAFLRKY